MDSLTDLFGLPVDPHHGQRGRPRHKPTGETRQRVRELRADGATLATIAAVLRITEPTLMLHYREQLGWQRGPRSRRAAIEPPPALRGRPPHKPTAETRQLVIDLRASGATLPMIAVELRISRTALVVHYREQIGRRWRRGEATKRGEADMQNTETLRRLETTEFFRVGAKAASSGAGRAARFASALALLPLEDRNLVLAALDEITRPMTARELEKALMQTDLGMTHRKAVVAALKRFDIVLVSKS